LNWPGHKFAAAFFATVLLVSLAGMAAFMVASRADDAQTGTMLAVFHPSTSEQDVFGKIILAGGRPIRPTWMPGTWIVYGDSAGFAGKLKAHGALGAYTSSPVLPQLAGCFAYVDSKAVQVFTINR
jgi:hypothetical protein